MKVQPVSNLFNGVTTQKNRQYVSFSSAITPPQSVVMPFKQSSGIVELWRRCFGISDKKIISKISEQNNLMQSLSIPKGKCKKVFNKLNELTTKYSIPRKDYYSLLENLANGVKDKKYAYEFILNRMETSCTLQFGFRKEHFDCYTKIFNKSNVKSEKDIPIINNLLYSSIGLKGDLEKQRINFIMKHLPTRGLDDISKSLDYYAGCCFGLNISDLDKLASLPTPSLLMSLRGLNKSSEKSSYATSGTIAGFVALYPILSNDWKDKDIYNLSTCYTHLNGDFPSAMKDFVLKNKSNPDLCSLILACSNSKKDKIDPQKLDLYKNLSKAGMDIISVSKVIDWTEFERMSPKTLDEYTNCMINLFKTTDITSPHIQNIAKSAVSSDGKSFDDSIVERLMAIRDIGQKSKNILEYADEEISNYAIDALFLADSQRTLYALDVIGEKNLVYSFKNKYNDVDAMLDMLYKKSDDFDAEPLIEAINPTNSKHYKTLTQQIKAFKSSINKQMSSIEWSKLTSKINSLTKERNDIVAKSIKDPKEALEFLYVYKTLYNANPKYLEAIKSVIPAKTNDEMELYYNMLNKLLLYKFGIMSTSAEVASKLNFSRSKYLPTLYKSDSAFIRNFKKLVKILENDKYKQNVDIFNKLEQNQKTAEEFQRYGLDYQKWVNYNPKSSLTVSTNLNFDIAKDDCVKNITLDFNSWAFKNIPEHEVKKLLGRLYKHGYNLKDGVSPRYDYDGWYDGEKNISRLTKSGKAIKFEDVKDIINIIKEEINTNEFWTKRSGDNKIDKAKETFKNQILNVRYNEIKTAMDKKLSKDKTLVIRKADMNNIQTALFLGNDASCCTAVNSFNGETSPNYIMNKCISAIEIMDGENSCGNTMCYMAVIDGRLALVLDNIELKPRYQNNNKIRDGIIDYAKMLCSEIGQPNIKIYACPNRHKVDLTSYPLHEHTMQIIGTTGDDALYFDFYGVNREIAETDRFSLYMYEIK